MADLTLQEVAKHNHHSSCWVIIQNKVYDVTEFLPEHPGGSNIILKYAGGDATSAYMLTHPPDYLNKYLPPTKHLGSLSASSVQLLEHAKKNKTKSKDELRVEQAVKKKPLLERILNLREIEDVARKVLSYKALAYYSSSAGDEISDIENARAFSRFFFHPRVMRPVSQCDPSTTILGFKSSIPVFVSGAALARLGHPLGEANITVGAYHASIIQMVSSNSSLSYADIAAARPSQSQPLFFQLYKHSNAASEKRIKEVEGLGYKAIFLTVDAIVAGSRERDVRAPWVEEEMEQAGIKRGIADVENPTKSEEVELKELLHSSADMNGTAGALLKNVDQDMTWDKTVPWLRSVTKLPIAIKGIQCVADAVLAVEAGVDAILLSNHGGRQLEYSLPPMEILYRLQRERPDIFQKTEVYIDGGIYRGTDVLKALCLGATAVGLGRPFLYAQSAYGAAGIVKVAQILEREITSGMRLLGARSVHDLVPEMVERVDWQPLGSKL